MQDQVLKKEERKHLHYGIENQERERTPISHRSPHLSYINEDIKPSRSITYDCMYSLK